MFEKKDVTLFTILTGFSLVVAVLYLFGYWSSFDINILQYIQVTDVLKLALYPLFLSFFGGIISFYIVPLLTNPDALIKGDESKFVSELPNKTKNILLLAIFGMTIFSFIFAKKSYLRWNTGGFLAAYFLIVRLGNTNILKFVIPNPAIQRFTLNFCILILCMALPFGKMDAGLILDSVNRTVVSTRSFKQSFDSHTGKSDLFQGQNILKYLGTAGDYFFFLSMDNSKTYVVKSSEMYFLEIFKNKEDIQPVVK